MAEGCDEPAQRGGGGRMSQPPNVTRTLQVAVSVGESLRQEGAAKWVGSLRPYTYTYF